VSTERPPGIIIAFDYGERRIGVATGNGLTATASPVGIVECRDGEPRWQEIDQIVAEWAPAAFVTGVPPQGSEHLHERISNFVQALENRYKLPVYLVDESLTSQAAEAALTKERREGTRKKRVKRGDIDQLAACIIAQRWLADLNPDD
jgi:putative Holliday junction resolvase